MTRRLFTPRLYQQYIDEQIIGVNRCGVWAGMGMGKTVGALTALDKLFISGYETKPALVTAPLRVARSTWPDEAAKWEHLRNMEVQPIIGTVLERKAALRNRNANVFTINYENLPWLMEELDGAWPFGRVIADESTKLKGFRLKQGTERAKALARISHVHATGWTNMTGTPSPNGLKDLWGQTWFLDAGVRLGRTFEAFKHRWFRPSWNTPYGIEPLEHAQDQIQKALADICLSLDAKDYFDIRDPIETTIYIDLPPKARALYTEMEKRMFMEIEGHEVEAFNAASRTMKCLQLANGAAYVEDVDGDENPRSKKYIEVHDEKIQALEDIVEEAAGMPVLVAYHFRSDLERLRKAFPKGRVLDQNPQTIRDWNAGKIPILFAHPASAGHGLNLQDGGNILAFFGHNWNLEEFLQIIERIGPTRQLQAGYDRAMFIYYIVARDTVDEDVMERRVSKRSVQDILLNALKRRVGP